MEIRITSVGAAENKALKYIFEQLESLDVIKSINFKNEADLSCVYSFNIDALEILKVDISKRSKKPMENIERLILELYNYPDNLSVAQITKRLNDFEYTTSTGKKFHRNTVKRIIDKWEKYYNDTGKVPPILKG